MRMSFFEIFFPPASSTCHSCLPKISIFLHIWQYTYSSKSRHLDSFRKQLFDSIDNLQFLVVSVSISISIPVSVPVLYFISFHFIANLNIIIDIRRSCDCFIHVIIILTLDIMHTANDDEECHAM
jgi:hypothetical protein